MNNQYYSSLEPYKIQLKEYCFLMEDTDKYSDEFKIFLPKIMPFFNISDKVKEWRENFIDNIFVNDVECKVNTARSLILQNYIVAKRKRNAWFKYHPSTFSKGTRLMCEIPEGNIRHIRILDDDFNVDKVDKLKDVFIRNPSFEILDKINVGDVVKASYIYFTRESVSSYDSTDEMNSQGLNPCDFDCNTTFQYTNFWGTQQGTGDVTCQRTHFNKMNIGVGEGDVISVHDWGVIVNIDNVYRHITPDRILGFYKKAGEYYSYFEDSYDGGVTND